MKNPLDGLDKKCLVEAIGLMLLSWGALIPVYLLLVARKNKNKNKEEREVKKIK